jgi:TolA-binding protein
MRDVADLHPEALLDRDARGELSAADRARLDAHLVKCATCRFERQLRRDFADDLESDVTSSAVEMLLSAGAAAVQPEPRVSVRPAPPPPGSIPPGSLKPALLRPASLKSVSRPRVSRASWLLVAAAVLAASAAGASGMGQRALSRILGEPLEPVAASEAPAAAPSVKQVVHHRGASAPAPVLVPAPSPSPAPVESTDVLVAAPPPERPEPPHHVSASSAASAESVENGSSALFEAATEARRRGDYTQAIALQRELVARFPQSRESHVSRATVGRLLLDRGDPSAALASFDAYLAGGSGELGEETMVGRATALERLGRSAEAAGAWQSLLAAYPNTPYAAHARARLGSGSLSER